VELPDEEQTEDSDKMSVAVVNKTKDLWPTKGSVVFDDVKLRYGEELPNVLKGVSFSIKPGMKVGICGRTG
jgi:ATP-binding cassette, subfamily C (CFTR/MRP), member 1